MGAKDDWIEDVRRWCLEAPLADVEALACGMVAAGEGGPAPVLPSFEEEASDVGPDPGLPGSPHDHENL
jgi:hypothetical protein